MNIIISSKKLEELINDFDYTETGLDNSSIIRQKEALLDWLNSLNTSITFILEDEK